MERRFWAKVERAGPDECWPWQAGTNEHGYGRISTTRARGPQLAHRIAWELTFGPIPDGLKVLHSCDNPPCCNPAHLWLGTQTDNMRDAARKGRCKPSYVRGERHGRSRQARAREARGLV